MDEVQIYNRTLTVDEISQLYSAGLAHQIATEYNSTFNTTGRVGYWKLDNNYLDSSGEGNNGTPGGNTGLPMPLL